MVLAGARTCYEIRQSGKERKKKENRTGNRGLMLVSPTVELVTGGMSESRFRHRHSCPVRRGRLRRSPAFLSFFLPYCFPTSALYYYFSSILEYRSFSKLISFQLPDYVGWALLSQEFFRNLATVAASRPLISVHFLLDFPFFSFSCIQCWQSRTYDRNAQ